MNDAAGRGAGATRRFLGWRMVGVAFVADFIGVGFLFYSYGVFFKALAADFGGSRLGVSAGLMIVNLVGAAAAPFVGRAADRVPVRRIMLAGSLATAAGFACLSAIGSLWHFYLLLGTLIALGTISMGNIVAATLVSNWFVARRGTALGVATIGISLSGLVMPPVATWLIEQVGWRGGFLVYAAGTFLIVTPLVARFVVSRPEDVGLAPDGKTPAREPGAAAGPADGKEEPGDSAAAAAATLGALSGTGASLPAAGTDRVLHTREILRDRNFWSIAAPFSLILFGTAAVLTHMVPYVTDRGIEPYRAAAVLSITAGCGVAGKIVFGWLVDRVDPRVAVWTSIAGETVGLALLLASPSYAAIAFAAAVFGFGMGGTVPLQSTLIGIAFGRLSYGKAIGLLRPVAVPLHAMGVPVAGWLFDTTGSYELAFRIFLGAYLLAAVLVGGMRLRRPQ